MVHNLIALISLQSTDEMCHGCSYMLHELTAYSSMTLTYLSLVVVSTFIFSNVKKLLDS